MSTLKDFFGAAPVVPSGPPLRNPRTLVTWNVNGLASRMRGGAREWAAFAEYVTRESPDVVGLQEVKLPAHSSKDAVKDDGRPRDRGRLKDNTKSAIADTDLVRSQLNKQPFTEYNCFWTLSDWKYSGVLLLVKKTLRVRGCRFNLSHTAEITAEHYDESHLLRTLIAEGKTHHPDGRIICLSFQDLDVLVTYSPNHGWDDDHWRRRDDWDDMCVDYLSWREQLMQRTKRPRPLVWLGDLNCAPMDYDLTHPEWFKRQTARDLSTLSNPSQYPSERIGQAGCAPKERDGFQRILRAGRLVDAYRHRFPNGPPVVQKEPTVIYDATGAHFTWRGTPGVVTPQAGKYYAKGMRIDHCLVSELALDWVRDVKILGRGADRIGFWGSDHCPVQCTMECPDTFNETAAAPTLAAEASAASEAKRPRFR